MLATQARGGAAAMWAFLIYPHGSKNPAGDFFFFLASLTSVGPFKKKKKKKSEYHACLFIFLS